MICDKGSEVTETEHEVKTLKTAKEWYASVIEVQLPVTIRQYTSRSGRCMIRVFDANKKLIHQRG
jgi:hypothetical protein